VRSHGHLEIIGNDEADKVAKNIARSKGANSTVFMHNTVQLARNQPSSYRRKEGGKSRWKPEKTLPNIYGAERKSLKQSQVYDGIKTIGSIAAATIQAGSILVTVSTSYPSLRFPKI